MLPNGAKSRRRRTTVPVLRPPNPSPLPILLIPSVPPVVRGPPTMVLFAVAVEGVDLSSAEAVEVAVGLVGAEELL